MVIVYTRSSPLLHLHFLLLARIFPHLTIDRQNNLTLHRIRPHSHRHSTTNTTIATAGAGAGGVSNHSPQFSPHHPLHRLVPQDLPDPPTALDLDPQDPHLRSPDRLSDPGGTVPVRA